MAGNNLTVFNDDTFIVSYPRSGNTWVRFLLGKYLYGNKFDFITKEKFIPAIKGNTDEQLLRAPHPRLLKSHSLYCSKYPKVLYLLRDPRDVFVSHYYWFKKYPDKWKGIIPFDIKKYSDFFFEGKSKFGRWDNHYYGWKNNSVKIKNNIYFVKYESLRVNTMDEFKNILSFLNIKIVDEKILQAISNASFSSMSKMENEQQDSSKELLASNKDIKFVRSGKSEWREFLTPDIVEKFKIVFGNLLIELQYEKDLHW